VWTLDCVCVWVLGLFEAAALFSALITAAWSAWMSLFFLCVCCMVRRRWRLAFMEDDGAGLMKKASNDGGLGECDGTTLEKWRSFWKKRTEF